MKNRKAAGICLPLFLWPEDGGRESVGSGGMVFLKSGILQKR